MPTPHPDKPGQAKRDALAESYSDLKATLASDIDIQVKLMARAQNGAFKAGYDARDEEVKRLREALIYAQKRLIGGSELGGVFWRDVAFLAIDEVLHESGGANG